MGCQGELLALWLSFPVKQDNADSADCSTNKGEGQGFRCRVDMRADADKATEYPNPHDNESAMIQIISPIHGQSSFVIESVIPSEGFIVNVHTSIKT